MTAEDLPPQPTYEIVEQGRAIHCRVCGKTSWHQRDIEHRFCGNCRAFHEPARLEWGEDDGEQ